MRPFGSKPPDSMKRIIDLKNDKEVNEAYAEARRGAIAGAARWGLFSALVGAGAYLYSPIFRSLTIQFKVFLQLSTMTMGGMIEGDRRMRAHEAVVRQRKRLAQKSELWKRYVADAKGLDNDYVGGGDDDAQRKAAVEPTAKPRSSR